MTEREGYKPWPRRSPDYIY